MSRSYRLAIIKERPRNQKKSTLYHRRIRRILKSLVKPFKYRWQYQENIIFAWFIQGKPVKEPKFFNIIERNIWFNKMDEIAISGYISNNKEEQGFGSYNYSHLETTLPDPRSIINDYDYCDYIIDYEFRGHNAKFWLRGVLDFEYLKYRRK